MFCLSKIYGGILECDINTQFINCFRYFLSVRIDYSIFIDFIANKIVEQKDLVNAIIIYTFSTKTYAENLASYKQCLLILQQINTMLKGLVEKPKKEDE